MSNTTESRAGSVVALWRYPVKSMMGEEVNCVDIETRGVVGDRAHALVATSTGKVVSAKNPKRWPMMFDFRAAYVESPQAGEPLPAVRIALPDGRVVCSTQGDVEQILSDALGDGVKLETRAPTTPSLEEYWPDMDELDKRDSVTDETILSDTFFDGAAVHLLTTATIDQLRVEYPDGRFEARRFRPNIVVAPEDDNHGFVENDWVGHTLAIGETVRLKIDRPCPRCVMTTLPQADLPRDTGILRTALKKNTGHVGVYATVLAGGSVKRGDNAKIVD